jgi:hypothetical protein
VLSSTELPRYTDRRNVCEHNSYGASATARLSTTTTTTT